MGDIRSPSKHLDLQAKSRIADVLLWSLKPITTEGFWSLARENPLHGTVIDPNGKVVTAGELLAASNQLVHGLRTRGLRPGSVIAIAMKNRPAALELHLAAAQAGWYVVPVNVR